jgi:hypothetical protein
VAKRQAATGNRQPGASIDVGGDDNEELGNRFLQVDDRRSVSPLMALDGDLESARWLGKRQVWQGQFFTTRAR